MHENTRPWTEHDLHHNVIDLKPSATLWINERSKKLSSEGRTIYRLGLGQSPFPVPPGVVAALSVCSHEKDYLPVLGLPALREAVRDRIERFEGIKRSADDVIIGPGSKELIYMVQLALNARLILPSPSWVSYAPQSMLLGRDVSWIETSWAQGLRLRPEEVETACLAYPGERLIFILNTPNNPTGISYDETELRAFAEVFRRFSVLVISDEIYSETHFEAGHISIARYYPEGTIISNGISKWAGAGGWRLGWICAPQELSWLIKAMARIASETFTSVSAPIQYAAILATEDSLEMENYLKKSQKLLGRLCEISTQRLQKANIEVCESSGGFYLFISLENYREQLMSRGISTGLDLAQTLLDEISVACLEGSHFGRGPEELSLRLALVDFDGSSALEAIDGSEHITVMMLDRVIEAHCSKVIYAIELMCSWLKDLSHDQR